MIYNRMKEAEKKERKKTHHYAYFVTCFAPHFSPHLLSKLYLQKAIIDSGEIDK